MQCWQRHSKFTEHLRCFSQQSNCDGRRVLGSRVIKALVCWLSQQSDCDLSCALTALPYQQGRRHAMVAEAFRLPECKLLVGTADCTVAGGPRITVLAHAP